MSTETVYDVVWPRGKRKEQVGSISTRLDALENKTVCALWDWLFRGDEIFSAVSECLAKKYPSIKFIDHTHFGSTHGGNEAETLSQLPQRLSEKECDAVLSGMGC
ncbi:hypothetical protein ACFLWF_00120 [Chloroflexota bacterium]